jgi:hypothetical protein
MIAKLYNVENPPKKNITLEIGSTSLPKLKFYDWVYHILPHYYTIGDISWTSITNLEFDWCLFLPQA